ncbi:MAG: hypothetical protein U0228_08485 [Myxococcaceae bacterium]
MAIPFSTRWEVTSLRWNQGSFVEAARVRPLEGQVRGEWWVERPVAGLKPLHEARVKRRWWLASLLTSPIWPSLLDAGDDGGAWAVIDSPGRRTDGTFPFADPQLAVAAVRGMALGVAEAEGMLLAHCTSPHLSVRPSLLARDEDGVLRLHLAALDPEPDIGFPSTPQTWMWSAEELLGVPQTARSNVFALGWMAVLMLTGRSPWGAPAEGQTESQRREALKALVAQQKFQFSLPDPLKPLEAVLKRALSANPNARFQTSAQLAEALQTFAPGNPHRRTPAAVQLAVPAFEPRFETLSPQWGQRLVTAADDSPAWMDLAMELEVGGSPRAKLIRGDESAKPELTPSLAGELCELGWRRGYVRTMSVKPGPEKVARGEERAQELAAFLQHPSFQFLQDLTLAGPLEHARTWLDALQRHAPPYLKRVQTDAIAATDTIATDIAFRFPRWTWVWGQGSGGFFKRLFGR